MGSVCTFHTAINTVTRMGSIVVNEVLLRDRLVRVVSIRVDGIICGGWCYRVRKVLKGRSIIGSPLVYWELCILIEILMCHQRVGREVPRHGGPKLTASYSFSDSCP